MQVAPARWVMLAPRRVALAGLLLGVAGLHLGLLWPRAPVPARPGVVAVPAARNGVWQVVEAARPPVAAPAGPPATPTATGAATTARPAPARAAVAIVSASPPRPDRTTATVAAEAQARATGVAGLPRPAAPARPLAPTAGAGPADEAAAAPARSRLPEAAEPALVNPLQSPGAAPRTATAEPVPVYATQLPPPARLVYRLQRDGAVGAARLDWERDGAQYHLRLEGEVDGRPLGGATSRGAIDGDGLAPLRLADLRRGREVRAANFRRDEHRITFSGPAVEHPLLPGTQDRLSWMIQLPAVVQANPALGRAGARVTLLVVGTRGDAEAWHFEAQGAETVDLPGAAVPGALRFVREPVRPYDLQVEIWLDPARGHLPVRARLATRPETRTTEWQLAAIGTP